MIRTWVAIIIVVIVVVNIFSRICIVEISAKEAKRISCSCNNGKSRHQLKTIFKQIDADCHNGETTSKFEGVLIPQVGLKLLEMGYKTEQYQEEDNCYFTVFW